jgi:type IV pilus assembly protein PilW
MKAAAQRRQQYGLTLVELLIAMALGLVLVLAATVLLLSAKASYVSLDQLEQVEETGRYASEVVARAIRQAGYDYRDVEQVSFAVNEELSPNVIGMDAMTLKKSDAALTSATARDAVNGSDILALRFFGDDTGTPGASGAILNCAGLSVAAAEPGDDAEDVRGWSIFFVAKDSGGEPELRCKYETKNGWSAEAVARGVESFQVLYGVDTTGDGAPDRFVNADGIDALDARLALQGNNAAERLNDMKRRTYWKKVRAIRFALLVRGSEAAREDAPNAVYHLFGDAYSAAHAQQDKGVRIGDQEIAPSVRKRIRKLFLHTIQLRNDPVGSET